MDFLGFVGMDFLGYLGLRASLRGDFVLNLHDVLIVRILSPCLLLTALAATSRAFLTAWFFNFPVPITIFFPFLPLLAGFLATAFAAGLGAIFEKLYST